MAQAQGSNTQIIIGEETVFKTTPQLVIHDCEAAWDDAIDAEVTATADATVYKTGSKSCKLVVAAGAEAGDLLGTDDVTAKNLSAYTHISFWIRSSVVLAAGDLQILLDDTADCVSAIETLDVPAVATVDTWQFCKIALVAPASCTAIISIGVKMVVDKAGTFYFDQFVALKQGRIFAYNSETLGMTRSLITSKAIRTSRQPQRPSLGKKDVAGNITMELHPQLGLLLYHLMGAVAHAGAGSPYTHTFTVGTSLPVGLTIDKYFADIDQCFRENGCKVSAMSISTPDEGPIPVTFDFMGASEEADTTGLPFDSDPIDNGFTPFDIFEGSITRGGSSLGTVTKFDLKVENNLDGSVFVIDGTGERYSLPAGKIKVSGNLECLFEDLTLYNLALNNTETALQFIFTKGTGAGTATNEKLTINLDEIIFAPKSPDVSGDAGIKINLPFEAYYDNDAQASAIWMELLNPTATY